MAAIRTEGLDKAYGEAVALDGLTLEIDAGELYGILGPNGAGKTTAIEVLTGQTAPDAGEARVLGRDPAEDPVGVRRDVGILPETEPPPSFLTPREYVHFVGDVRDLPDPAVDRGLRAWAGDLGLEGKLDTLSADLSRGEQQKVMIAAAFLHEPEVVFIDEPLVNLDPLVQERVKGFLADYRAEGNTVLLSTHNVEVASDLCSRVGVVHEGRLVAEVDPDELDPDDTLLDVFLEEVGDEDAAGELADG